MKAFINRGGIVLELTETHQQYCTRKRLGLARYLKDNIRVATFKGVIACETLQKTLTDTQLKAIKKLYKEYRCHKIEAGINGQIIKELKELIRVTA